MSFRPLAVAVCSALTLPIALSVRATEVEQAPKPVKEHLLYVDGGRGMPPTFQELWELAELIAEGVIQGERPADRIIPLPKNPPTIVRTAFTVRLLEIFKPSDEEVPASIEFLQLGGARDRGTHIDVYRQDRMPSFQKGERYLLFINRHDDGQYVLTTGTADSVFLLTESKVVPRGNSALARELAQLGRAALVAQLRAWRQR